MPWFPDFVSAAQLARSQGRHGRSDPVGQYLRALSERDSRGLESAWDGEVVIEDPRAGRITGHRPLEQFVAHNLSWLASRRARVETVSSVAVDGRAVVELVAHLDDADG